MNSLPRLVGAQIDKETPINSNSTKILTVTDTSENGDRSIKYGTLDEIKVNTESNNVNSMRITDETGSPSYETENNPNNALVKIDSKIKNNDGTPTQATECRTALEVYGGHRVVPTSSTTQLDCKVPAVKVHGAMGFYGVQQDGSEATDSTVFIEPSRYYGGNNPTSTAQGAATFINKGNTYLGMTGESHETVVNGNLTVKDGSDGSSVSVGSGLQIWDSNHETQGIVDTGNLGLVISGYGLESYMHINPSIISNNAVTTPGFITIQSGNNSILRINSSNILYNSVSLLDNIYQLAIVVNSQTQSISNAVPRGSRIVYSGSGETWTLTDTNSNTSYSVMISEIAVKYKYSSSMPSLDDLEVLSTSMNHQYEFKTLGPIASMIAPSTTGIFFYSPFLALRTK